MKKDYVIIILIGLVVALMATTVVLITRDADKKEEVIEDVVIAEPKPTIESKEETKDPTITARKEESAQEPKEEVVEENVQEKPIEEEFDQFEMYKVDEDWIQNCVDILGLCYVVERDNKLYSFGPAMSSEIVDEYGVGYQVIGYNPEYPVYLYMWDEDLDDVPTDAYTTMTTAGDFQVFQIEKDEKVRIYSKTSINSFDVGTGEFYGYTIMGTKSDKFHPIIDHNTANFWNSKQQISNITLSDMNGDPVDDVRDLEYGQEYMYSWFEGTQYYEMQCIANSKSYTIDGNWGNCLRLPVELTKNGYLEGDISSLSAGFYYVDTYTLFEVVDEFHVD